MNIENAKTLVGQLKRLPDEKFWMPDYIIHPEEFRIADVPRTNDCGTVACIAGWACINNGGPTSEYATPSPHAWATEWLSLTSQEAHHLFRGKWCESRPLGDVTRSQAIAELERLIAEAEGAS